MDKRSQRLKKVIAIAELEERNECLVMKKVQQTLDTACERLGELIEHQRRYQTQPLPKGSVGAMQWSDFQRFQARLGDAVKYQSRQVRQSEQLLETHLRRWQQRRRRVRMLEEVMQRYCRAEAERDQQQMQKVLDELQPMLDPFRI